MPVESAESDASSVGMFPPRSNQSVKVQTNGNSPIDLVTVLEAILTSGQAREKKHSVYKNYENVMSNKIHTTAILKKIYI